MTVRIFQKPHTIRGPYSAQDIDDNFNAIAKKINELIAAFAASGGAGTDGIDGLSIIGPPGDDGEDGPPGPPGERGAIGAAGPTGATGPFSPMALLEPDDPDPVWPIPGPQGPKGDTGASGPAGAAGGPMGPPGEDGEDGEIWMIPMAGGGGATPWTLIATRTCTGNANEDFTNLGAYSELLVLTSNITRSNAVAHFAQFSSDNGATWVNGATDYQSVASTGVITTAQGMGFFQTGATPARSGSLNIFGFNVAGAPKVAQTSRTDFPMIFLVASVAAMNALRISVSAGTMNAGTIYVFGRP